MCTSSVQSGDAFRYVFLDTYLLLSLDFEIDFKLICADLLSCCMQLYTPFSKQFIFFLNPLLRLFPVDASRSPVGASLCMAPVLKTQKFDSVE